MSTQQEQVKAHETDKRNLLKKEKPYVYDKIMKYDDKIKNGESIAILQFQYDYTCNFTCEHCSIDKFQHKTKKEREADTRRFFTPKDVKELSRQADEMGLAHIVITGGEPLIFPDFDDIVEAINPNKFYITSDTNGWLLDEKRAKHMKKIGIDKIQLSLDNFSPTEHDKFRHKDNSYERIMRAVDAALDVGLNLIFQTVLTKHRARSQEFLDLLEFSQARGIGVYVTYAKPVGAWEGNFDVLITQDDADYVRELEKKYPVFTHMTPSYGLDLGCIAVKRMVSITKYGDVMPCPYIHISLGNFFKEPLKDIIERGLSVKWFGKYTPKCLIGENNEFIDIVAKNVYGKPLPVPYSEVFTSEDLIDPNQRQLFRP
ncbi:MAG: radical SAM protein [Nitrospirae bacterium]|nr:radical SAM protein [Nitrospirota bacterium]